ncbi:MAG TPA: metallophosphoesterase, partial [Polyangiaceae bacterium]
CELAIPAGAKSVVAAGRVLPLPKAVPNRIAVIGDTGCRLKQGNPWQACSDPTEWPFKEVADNAAALSPDLVLHVGDYHYRENQCPPDIAGCQGSPWGYGWDVWEQDLFLPASKLLAAAPWVVVRGNHEECARGGQGWFRFLDTLPYDSSRSCDLAANDDVANYNAPYAVPVGADSQFIVFDSSKVGGAALNPASATDGPIFARYQSELQSVASLAADPNIFSIFTNHHPLLAYTSVAGANPSGGNPALLSVMAATFPGSYFPPNIKLVLEGHNHIFEAIDYSTPHPVSIITGNAGDNLDINLPDPFPLGPAASGGDEPAPGVVADAIAHMSSFGFLILDRVPGGWKATEYRHDGTVMDTCNIDGASDKISCATLGFLH